MSTWHEPKKVKKYCPFCENMTIHIINQEKNI